MSQGYERIKAMKKLAREHGLPWNIPDLLALAPKNDPFYAGSPASRRDAEWFVACWRDLRFTAGTHTRRIHYRLVSGDTPVKKPDGKPSKHCRRAFTRHSPPVRIQTWTSRIKTTGCWIRGARMRRSWRTTKPEKR
jgi:hypothetical protein